MSNFKGLFASISVDDLAAAKQFYGGTLGLTIKDDSSSGMTMFEVGDGRFIGYEKEGHTPASFTVLNFEVDDVEAAVDALAEAGVSFEQYPEFKTNEKGVATSDQGSIAWFKDPAGNILSLVSM